MWNHHHYTFIVGLATGLAILRGMEIAMEGKIPEKKLNILCGEP